jgi:2-polyprenyl-3-methyl-5-hydroxy-6-metoxy-1,4-benzoquinol methylase
MMSPSGTQPVPAGHAGDDKTRQGSPDRFGYEWATYADVLPESKGQLLRWLGSTGLASFRGKRVLDVGCGMGRNPYWMLEAGAASVTAVDVDERSLAAARKNLARFDRARVERGSVYELDPTRLGVFDRVTCIGVLHHLAAPEEALAAMWRCVAPGGDLVLWCYGKEGNELLLPVIRGFQQLGSRLPLPVTHAVARATALAVWPALRLVPWRTEYYRNLRLLSFGNVESIIFDQMLPKIAHYWRREDMERLAAPLGGSAQIELVQGNSWHVRIVRAAGAPPPSV